MSISLRGRLALWFALTMPALIFALVFAARHVMVGSLYTSLDGSLEDRARVVAASVSDASDSRRSYIESVRRLTEQGYISVPLLLRIADPEGNILATVGNIPRAVVPGLDRQLRLASGGEGRFDNIGIRGTQTIRAYTLPLHDPASGNLVALIQTGESLAQLDRAQDRLWLYAIVVGVAGSLLAIGMGALVLRWTLRPLDRILRRVRDIETNNLQVGLPEEPRPPELQQLADSLNGMLRRLNDAFKAKQVFVASVSHDLRTPLTALQGQIDVLLMQSSLSTDARESLERMSRETRRLVRMTNNLLLNAQLESNPSIVPEPVDLRALAEEVVGDVWVLAEGLELGLKGQQDVTVQGDRDLLKQLLLNLMDNAIKFTPKGGRVELALSASGGHALLEVSDTGQGIPREHLPHIMEPFYKADRSGSRAGGGAGLGLTIVKQIVKLHGGRIEIQSQVGSGTSVKVWLLTFSLLRVVGPGFLECR